MQLIATNLTDMAKQIKIEKFYDFVESHIIIHRVEIGKVHSIYMKPHVNVAYGLENLNYQREK
jgi:hypothetical protein